MLFAVLAFAAVVLTYAMFQSKNAMLGFPSAIFWMLTGGRAYTLSAAPWDLYFLIAFACLLGMVTFCAFGAYGLREKRDTIADEEMEKGEGELIDDDGESGNNDMDAIDSSGDKPAVSDRTRGIRERAERRRSGTRRKGEFNF
jgi:hypothetical protein